MAERGEVIKGSYTELCDVWSAGQVWCVVSNVCMASPYSVTLLQDRNRINQRVTCTSIPFYESKVYTSGRKNYLLPQQSGKTVRNKYIGEH